MVRTTSTLSQDHLLVVSSAHERHLRSLVSHSALMALISSFGGGVTNLIDLTLVTHCVTRAGSGFSGRPTCR
jgi:hypothetical protein